MSEPQANSNPISAAPSGNSPASNPVRSRNPKRKESTPYRMLTDSEKQSLRTRAKWVSDWAKQQLAAKK